MVSLQIVDTMVDLPGYLIRVEDVRAVLCQVGEEGGVLSALALELLLALFVFSRLLVP